MKKSLLIVFLLLVIAPLGVISWLSYSNIARERAVSAERYAILARKQLEQIDRLLQVRIRELEARLREYSDIYALEAEELRRIARNTRIVDQLFVIDDEHRFVFPPESGELSAREAEFLETAGRLELPLVLGNGGAAGASAPGAGGVSGPDTGAERGQTVTGMARNDTAGAGGGWYTWFMDEGVHFLYWQMAENGYRTGVVIDRIAFISDIIAALPDSDFTESTVYEDRIVMTDARGDVLYQWGLYSPGDGETPVAAVALSQPLGSWRLLSYVDTGSGTSLSSRYGALLPGAAAGVIILILLSVYFYRENKKIVEDALQKVSFVNQVSHELRTPLTNIRLYTELLKERASEGKDRRQLDIVLSESTRLSRMIANVLTFARSEKNGYEANPARVAVDDVIRKVVESFAVSLESKSMQVVLSCNAPGPVVTDRDFLEQIVSNLIGNAEKYAASGKYLEIASSQDGGLTRIFVKDRGPGIPARERTRIFEPFYRISNKLTDGVSGAGIGLAVSKMLAEKIGGKLSLERDGGGAVFKIELPDDMTGETT
ncbi:MAG: HAMP domain-containing histidine kinase [Spirochaetales bacterium]|nr:HAMP domain-containing histidine kinase [Spirochaetales bacterium]